MEKLINLSGNVECTYINRQSNQIYAGINSSDSEFISIPIPYDEGWNIEINGEKIQYYSVNGGMIGFSIPKGYSEIHMIFIPQGFKMGMVASLTGVLLLIILVIAEKIQKKVKKQNL